jgi:predicted enzyme related to lactoylglutathione lyase
MSERDHYPPGVPCWIDSAQPDVDQALAFYGALFGWEFAGPGPMPGDGRYYVARLRGRDVAGISTAAPSAPDAPPGWMTHVAVASADRAAQLAESAGGAVLVAPFDAPPAGRMAVLSDPAGAVFSVWEAYARRGAQIVNEPSAWSMSALRTPDPEGAGAFYGAVFGWETEPFGPGFTLLRLPGYVGGEPTQPVPRDVVAVLTAADEEAAWGVDLWVSDAEVIAAKAADLGGTVLVAPREVQGFRNTAIADPHGAVLSASQLLAQ